MWTTALYGVVALIAKKAGASEAAAAYTNQPFSCPLFLPLQQTECEVSKETVFLSQRSVVADFHANVAVGSPICTCMCVIRKARKHWLHVRCFGGWL